jgi:uncharacterized membrane protein
MQTSIFLARLIGPVFLVIGLGMLLNSDGYRATAKEFLKSRALIYLAGLLALVPGVALVLTHNVWVFDWRLIITVFGWLLAAGGVFRILFPQQVMEIGKQLAGNDNYMLGSSLVVVVLSAVLIYYGFFA